jgi:hypothetical protein
MADGKRQRKRTLDHPRPQPNRVFGLFWVGRTDLPEESMYEWHHNSTIGLDSSRSATGARVPVAPESSVWFRLAPGCGYGPAYIPFPLSDWDVIVSYSCVSIDPTVPAEGSGSRGCDLGD